MAGRLKVKKNFTEGPIFFRMILFAIPIMLTGIMNLVYNMADNIIVGAFSGDDTALAAVGSTSSLTNLIVNLLLGVSAGTAVVVSRFYGAGDDKKVHDTVHTAMTFSLIGGIAFAVIGLIISKPVLTLMGTRPDVIGKAVLYLRIICLGIPASAVYNFGASILRSTGDSKTPLIILASTGLLNVGLNIVFVAVFHMTVEGVALATIISQYISALTVVIFLRACFKRGKCFGFTFAHVGIDKPLLLQILRYGVPAGIQSAMFSISNVLITSSINEFPTTTVAANTIAGNIDGISYTVMNAFSQAVMTFTGQNYGAAKPKRIKKVLLFGLIEVFTFGVAISQLELLFGRQIASLYIAADNPNKEVIIATVIEIITLLLTTYVLCGIMDVFSGFLRGQGYSLAPMLMSVFGICGIRIIWILTVFRIPEMHTYRGLMTSYPVSWSITILMMATLSIFALRKLSRIFGSEEEEDKKEMIEAKNV